MPSSHKKDLDYAKQSFIRLPFQTNVYNKLIFHYYFNKLVTLEPQWFAWKKLIRERTSIHFLHLLEIWF